jgi:putative Holliday junction resolvase
MNRALGIDFGRARIGLAISDELGMLAHPLETVPMDRDATTRIATIVRERNVDCVVAGVPKTMSGQLGPAANEALAFIEKLRAVVGCKIISWDERLTTVAAHRALQDAGKKAHQTRGYVDQVAAQMILQGYLDQQQMRTRPNDSLE